LAACSAATGGNGDRFEPNIFPARDRGPWGAVKSPGASRLRPRGSGAQFFANFRKLFLVDENRKKTPRNSGWGGR
jgi:hypothetical protein